MPIIYGCFALIVCLGFRLRKQRGAGRIALLAVGASVLFFSMSNLAVWALSGMYPRTGAGLVACYAAALPFLQSTLAGDLCFTGVLFGGMALAEWRFPKLQPACK
jgi:hypothetical protein